MNMRFYIYSCTLICMKRSEAIDQLREMDAKYSCYVYCKNELAVVLVGVERRRRFPTGDGACGIEII